MKRAIWIGWIFVAAGTAVIGTQMRSARGDRPHGPPPEAIEACAKLAKGDACTVTLHDRTLDGTCRNGPDGAGDLACMPAHPPGPPPEAIDACKNLTAGTPCSVNFDGHTMQGTCRTGRDGNGELACAPSGPPPADR